jgi:hypothetical protein
MIRFHKKSAHHLISAYNRMINTMREALENSATGYLPVQQAIQIARHDIVDSGMASAEEAYEIGESIKIDINDAADQLMESSEAFDDWISLDITAIEVKVMEAYLDVADTTRVELERVSNYTSIEPNIPVYSIGRIAQTVNLYCASCGSEKSFTSPAVITECEHCGHSHFIHRETD